MVVRYECGVTSDKRKIEGILISLEIYGLSGRGRR
jgi:hypothetical protein